MKFVRIVAFAIAALPAASTQATDGPYESLRTVRAWADR
jgi:hypothetical protein